MAEAFVLSSRLEWTFWDSAYRMEAVEALKQQPLKPGDSAVPAAPRNVPNCGLIHGTKEIPDPFHVRRLFLDVGCV